MKKHASIPALPAFLILVASSALLAGCMKNDPESTALCKDTGKLRCRGCCTSNGASGSSWLIFDGCTCLK